MYVREHLGCADRLGPAIVELGGTDTKRSGVEYRMTRDQQHAMERVLIAIEAAMRDLDSASEERRCLSVWRSTLIGVLGVRRLHVLPPDAEQLLETQPTHLVG